MAGEGERMQLRSMVDKNKENSGERSENTDPTQDNWEELDDIRRAARVSEKGVMMFWYIPDLKNTQLRDVGESRLPHPNDPLQILVKAPELRRFFKTSTFEICINDGKMYTYTDPKVDIGVSLSEDPFELNKLEKHFREITKVTEVTHRIERMPLMERTTPTTEVMTLKEFENNVNKFFKLCRMYGETSCELARRSEGSEEDTSRAYATLHPYICDILEQIEKGHNLFRIEREVRYQKGRGKLRIPYIAPKDVVIVNAKQLASFLETVDEELMSVIESARVQEEEFENREQARKEEEARQEQLRRNTGPTSLRYHTTTSTPLKTLAPYSTTSNTRQASRGVLFDPNPTRHSYAYRGNTNSNNDYDQLSGDSVSQGSDINDRISPTGNRDSNGEHRSDWQQGRTTGYGNRTTGTSGHTGFSAEQPQYQPRTPVICFKCGDPGHIRTTCQATDVYCTFCRTINHNNKACKKYNNPNDSPTNSTSSQGYHPTATPPQGDTNGLFAPTKTSTAVQSPIP